MNNFTIEEEILDCLADGPESIIQIIEQSDSDGKKYDFFRIKAVIEELLERKLIEITYPINKNSNDFKEANNGKETEFWFEMTNLGRKIWDNIVIK